VVLVVGVTQIPGFMVIQPEREMPGATVKQGLLVAEAVQVVPV
jgi:hypothetical protein